MQQLSDKAINATTVRQSNQCNNCQTKQAMQQLSDKAINATTVRQKTIYIHVVNNMKLRKETVTNYQYMY